MDEEKIEYLDDEDIEQIEMILDFEDTNVELAHRQQYVKILYKFYNRYIRNNLPKKA